MNYIKYENVKNMYSNINNNQITLEYHNDNIDKSRVEYFFLFECCMHSAFCHWIYESAILFPQYLELKKKYPNLKLLVNKNPNRKFKELFFNVFKINTNDIYFLDNKENIPHDCKTMYKNIPINNICLVSKHFQCLNSTLDVNLLTELIKNFKNIIEKNLNIDINNEKKNNEYLFFPRNKKENFKANNRTFDYTKVYEMLKNKKYVEYDTMNTDNFKNQVELLLSSNNIFLDWGASFFVNGLFCKNSNLYLTNCIVGQLGFNGMKTIYDIIQKNNNIIHLN